MASAAADYEITTDGRTVWINGPSGLLGRLGPRGIDVHGDPAQEVHCIDCGQLPENPWLYFVKSMQKHHGITIPDKYKPKWIK